MVFAIAAAAATRSEKTQAPVAHSPRAALSSWTAIPTASSGVAANFEKKAAINSRNTAKKMTIARSHFRQAARFFTTRWSTRVVVVAVAVAPSAPSTSRASSCPPGRRVTSHRLPNANGNARKSRHGAKKVTRIAPPLPLCGLFATTVAATAGHAAASSQKSARRPRAAAESSPAGASRAPSPARVSAAGSSSSAGGSRSGMLLLPSSVLLVDSGLSALVASSAIA